MNHLVILRRCWLRLISQPSLSGTSSLGVGYNSYHNLLLVEQAVLKASSTPCHNIVSLYNTIYVATSIFLIKCKIQPLDPIFSIASYVTNLNCSTHTWECNSIDCLKLKTALYWWIKMPASKGTTCYPLPTWVILCVRCYWLRTQPSYFISTSKESMG